MACFSGPEIVNDGLVLHLDAANPKSYPGSGTVWKDLSNTGADYSMYGSVPYIQEGKGAWDFSGNTFGTSGGSPLGFLPANGNIFLPSTNSFTITAFINQTTDAGQTGLFSNAGGANGVRFGPSAGGIYYLIGPSYKEGVIGANSFLLNTWSMLTVVYDRQGILNATPTVYAYVNDTLVGSVIQSTQTSMTNTSPGIVRSACCQRFIGKLSMILVNNTALTSAEIQQNFEATRSRYGI